MTEAVSKWKDYWLTLPDAAFFEAMRTFPLDLPPSVTFNKHKMVDALIRFFVDEKNRKTILDALDADDRKLLSAVALFPDLPPSRLYFFFRQNESEERFFFRLLNLEERLLIYRKTADTPVSLNPILEPDFRSKIIRADAFFPSETDTPPEPIIPLLSDSLLLSVAAFLAANRKALRADGELRKKPKEWLLNCLLAEREPEADAEAVFRLMITFLRRSGVLLEEDNSLVFEPNRFATLRTLSIQELLFLMMACDSRLPKTASLTENAALLQSLVSEMQRLKGTSDEAFVSLFYLLSDCRPQTETDAPLYRAVLTDCRFLLPNGDRIFVNPLLNLNEAPTDNHRSIIQDDGQILFSPGTPLEDSFFLPLFAEIVNLNFFPVFRITQQSLFRGFDAGLTPQEIASHLKSLSAHPLPPALEKKMVGAFEAYREVRLYTGVTVVLPPLKAAAAEKLPGLQTHLLARPSETVFIFPEESFTKVAEELSTLGLAHLPPVPRKKTKPPLPDENDLKFKPISLSFEMNNKIEEYEVGDCFLSEELHRLVQEKSYSESVKEDLDAKINKKIILFPQQIDLHAKLKDVSTASGLDFTRKLNLIKSAIKDSSYLLEISFFSDGKKTTFPAVPIELKRFDNRPILFYKVPGKEEKLSVDAEKIGSVRLLRSSLRLY